MRKKSLKLFVFLTLCIIFTIAINLSYYIVMMCIALLAILLTCNSRIKKKQNKQKMPFGVYSNIRNIDCLVIGDLVNLTNIIPANQSCIKITAAGRSMRASFEILKHTSSILKENEGEVYLVVDGNIRNNNFSVFDIQWLHPIIIRKYNLFCLAKKARFPIFFAPRKSLRCLLNITKPSQMLRSQSLDNEMIMEIDRYCQARGIKLHLLTI